jgi:hypothetical protein
MLTSQALLPEKRSRLNSMARPLLLLCLLLCFAAALQAQRATIAARALTATTADAASDLGQVPTSQPLTVTLRLEPTVQRAAALEQLLTAQTTASSPSYHHWLTPEQFAASYGATDDQLATLTTWAQSQGLSVISVSAAHTRLTLIGSADQVQRAFSVSLHRYSVSGQPHFAPSNAPSVPFTFAPMVASISGLDDLSANTGSLSAISLQGRILALSSAETDTFAVTAAAIDANSSPILTLTPQTCTSLAPSDLAGFQALFRQANAQGITVLASGSCTSDLLSLPEVTALTTAALSAPDTSVEGRPDWQIAPGLPNDALRHQPDLTTSSVTDLAQTLVRLLRETGIRQGNVNPIFYSLATSPGLYTQPDSAPAGTWKSATGLGLIDLTILAKVFPRAGGALATTTSLQSSTYTPNYGDSITFTAKVLAPVYGNANPTGTVTFSAVAQGVLGSATVDSSGTAIFIVKTALPVGTYNVTATYGGDTVYAGGSNASSVILTVSIVNASLAATVSPTANVPYGSTATVTATVSLPGPNAAPSGPVTAVVQGVTGASASATLSPNPGGNTASANITFQVPPPGSYTIEVTCTGTTNFQCQSPVDITKFTTVKGNTVITLTTTPAAPQAGQPVTLTANISAVGNGIGPYSFTGNITFYDNGKILGNGAIPVGSNQAAASITLSGNITHNIIASYSGDTNWNASTSAPQAVNPTLLPSTLTVTSNFTSALAGANIVITATVFTTVSNTVGPTGTVSFFDTYNGSIVQLGGSSGAITLTPNGPNQSIARFTTTGLLAGAHSIYAIYNGDSNFAPATSTTMPLNLTDYNLIMVPQTLTLKAGQTGQVVMLIGLVGGFNGTVSFGCTPPSGAEATCGFSPATLQGGGSTTMTVTTTAAKAKPTQQALSGEAPGSWSFGAGAGSAFATLLCLLLPRRRRALPFLLATLLSLSLFPSLGCGLGTTAAPTNAAPADLGTPLGTQIFNITTAGNDGVNTSRHNYQYQVTVQ